MTTVRPLSGGEIRVCNLAYMLIENVHFPGLHVDTKWPIWGRGKRKIKAKEMGDNTGTLDSPYLASILPASVVEAAVLAHWLPKSMMSTQAWLRSKHRHRSRHVDHAHRGPPRHISSSVLGVMSCVQSGRVRRGSMASQTLFSWTEISSPWSHGGGPSVHKEHL